MRPAAIPTDELRRLSALRKLMVLDTEHEEVFDKIARMAADICGTPVALMSLIDAERQWFKANVGLTGVTETPREIAFCAHAILEDDVFVVPDATLDDRFSDNPLVTGRPDIRFYAGAPIVLEGGERIGTLCVIDHDARYLDDAQLTMLDSLAGVASATLALRRDLLDSALSARSEYERVLSQSETHYRTIVDAQTEMISLSRPDGKITYANPSYAREFGRSPADLVGTSLFDLVEPTDREAVRAIVDSVVSTGVGVSSENRNVAADGTERWIAWTNGRHVQPQGQVLVHSVGRDVSQRKRIEEKLRASQSFLYRTGRIAGVGGWEVDLESGALTWSDETRRIHDVPPDYVPTLEQAIAFYDPIARATIEAAVAAGIERGESWDLELPLTTAAGRPIWVRAVGAVEHKIGKPVRLIGAFQDVTQRKHLEHQVASQSVTLRLVADAIPATVAVVGLDGRYRFVNSAFERWCGRKSAEVVGSMVRDVLGPVEFSRRWPWMQRAFAGESVTFELDYPVREGPSHQSLSYVPVRLETGEVDGFVVVTQDVTAHKRESLRLLELSQRDPLTGLLNRAGFEQFLERNLLEGGGESLAILYVDLDGFKAVNDTHGHAAGDRVLKIFAERLSGVVRPTDAVARLGGDEFAVALAGVQEQANARFVGDKILGAAHGPFALDGVVVSIGASVGVAFRADPSSGWAELMDRADAKLLSAKASGKGQQQGAAA